MSASPLHSSFPPSKSMVIYLRLEGGILVDGKKIDWRFKFLYTIGIISVLVGHGADGIDFFYDWFTPYSFHMPLFMFCSGYLFKVFSVK